MENKQPEDDLFDRLNVRTKQEFREEGLLIHIICELQYILFVTLLECDCTKTRVGIGCCLVILPLL